MSDSDFRMTPLRPATGLMRPLAVSKSNPRYFCVAGAGGQDEEIVYLTGVHINNNFQDGAGLGKDCAKQSERFDYPAYLDFLTQRGHNFMRLWRWEHFRSQIVGGIAHLCMTPQPWPRTGPGKARDDQPKFDLSRFDDAYFGRLRERVEAARDHGIYVSVMLFEGNALHLTTTPDNVEGHPLFVENNINGISIESMIDCQVLPLDHGIRALQEAYMRRVIDTLSDLPNVIYEVVNESSGMVANESKLPDGSSLPTPVGDSTEWQHWVMDFVRGYETERGYACRPIGMTSLYPVAVLSEGNQRLLKSGADWISPGCEAQVSIAPGGEGTPDRWLVDPPVNDGTKVVLSDNDHYSPMKADLSWPWRSFLRGHNPILYDLSILGGVAPSDPSRGQPSFDSMEPVRLAMGDTRTFANDIDLKSMLPAVDASSTGYCLASATGDRLVFQPDGSRPFDVQLIASRLDANWFNVRSRQHRQGDAIDSKEPHTRTFRSPFGSDDPVVLHLAQRP